ncbi:MAG: hypothetical protein CVV24_15215 [Ignavibacteriae bacterium HGW-Ignavibacteriae-3]|nr:MAG: hypothetical protein CVV24_15215 [Ignavibacteriae bacterium HGW-Ignavibacteriae-3]
MKRAILFFALFFLVSSAGIFAQGRMTREERVKQYQERLKLNADQTKKVDAIFVKMEQKTQKMRDSGNRENFREEMTKINKETNDQIMKILKPAQKEELKKMIEERMNRMPGQGQGRNRQQ